MFKALIVIHRKPGVSEAEFRRHWREVHGPKAARIPGLVRYVQNHAPRDATGKAPFCDGIAEMWYADEAAYRASRESPEARAAVADLAAFVDRARIVYLFVDEETVV